DGGDALRFEKRLVPNLRALAVAPPYFHQTTEFTCGPACIMMAQGRDLDAAAQVVHRAVRAVAARRGWGSQGLKAARPPPAPPASLFCAPAAAQQKLDKVSFGTNWLAEAEHGGHYQALVDGIYRRYGLDVTIVPGGPNVNNRLLLPVGKLDFFMSANTLQS